jgi:glucokinase-like ROK family protein
MNPIVINQSDMRKINRAAVLEFIRTHGSASRTEIANQLGLSLPTVMRIIDDVTAENLVCATGERESSKGRSRELLALNTAENAVVGLDLGGTTLCGALVNIGAKVLSQVEVEHHAVGDAAFDQLCEMIEQLLTVARKVGITVRGISVGAPGIVARDSGVVRIAPSLGWTDFPLLEKLSACFNVPVAVENDVNLAVLGEHWYGAGQGVSDMVLMTIGTGIGAGILSNGVLQRGFNESSGEIGYLLPGREYLGCSYSGFGALESLASGTGIKERGQAALRELGRKREDIDQLTAKSVFEACRDGEDWAQSVVDETVDYLTIAIANISAVLDPELIVIGGGVALSSDLLLEPIRARLKGVMPLYPRLAASQLGSQAAIFGGIVRLLHQLGEYHQVSRMS